MPKCPSPRDFPGPHLQSWTVTGLQAISACSPERAGGVCYEKWSGLLAKTIRDCTGREFLVVPGGVLQGLGGCKFCTQQRLRRLVNDVVGVQQPHPVVNVIAAEFGVTQQVPVAHGTMPNFAPVIREKLQGNRRVR
jgi:hypothetical protein